MKYLKVIRVNSSNTNIAELMAKVIKKTGKRKRERETLNVN